MKFELFTVRNIVIGFLLLGFVTFFSEFYSIFVILFSAFIIFAGLKPLVDYLDNKRFQRPVAVGLVMISFILIVVAFLFFIFNTAYREVRLALVDVEFNATSIQNFVDEKIPAFSQPLTDFIDKANKVVRNEMSLNDAFGTEFFGNLNGLGSTGLRIAGGIVSGLFNVFLVVFISLYMILPKKDFFVDGIKYFVKDTKLEEKWIKIFKEIKTGLGFWLIGQIVLMVFIGVLTFVVISLPGLFIQDYDLGRFAVLLALIAGILEALPNLGPTITLVIAVLLAVLTGSSAVVIVYILISFVLIQQLEGVFLVPVVMKKAIDLNPIVSIVVIIAGFALTGSAVGALLSIPFAGAVNIIFRNLR